MIEQGKFDPNKTLEEALKDVILIIDKRLGKLEKDICAVIEVIKSRQEANSLFLKILEKTEEVK